MKHDVVFMRFQEMPGLLLEASEVGLTDLRQFMFDANSRPEVTTQIITNMGAPQRVTYTALSSTLAAPNHLPGPIPVPALYIRAVTQISSEDDLRLQFPGIGVVTVPRP